MIDCPLRQSDLSILREFANGYTADQISSKLGISKHTIIDIARKMRNKVYACNITHLVAMALREGWIK